MTLKNYEIQELYSILNKISQGKIDKVKVSYRIGKILQDLEKHIKAFDKAREELIEKYAERDKEGKYQHPENDGKVDTSRIVLSDPQKFNAEVSELADEETDIKFSAKLTLDDLEHCQADLTVQNVMVLELLFETEKEEA